jgi:hypothetical protein
MDNIKIQLGKHDNTSALTATEGTQQNNSMGFILLPNYLFGTHLETKTKILALKKRPFHTAGNTYRYRNSYL